ncbi:MAG: histidine--tRNA ligase [Bacteroidia bacterium]
MQKASNAKGTRDFSPEVLRGRNHILKVITHAFKTFGFEQIQTPAIENLSTLSGKYGEEGDQLLFKILNSGPLARHINTEDVENDNQGNLIRSLSEKGLRYDLTVPFARYVVQHRNDITFPFRRYQVQEVWRADRPQKGRYREFTQCDADIIGSDSMINEADLVLIYNQVFKELKLNDAVLKMNHRKLLEALVELVEAKDFSVLDFSTSLDKLDKIGKEGVQKELENKGLNGNQIDQLFEWIDVIELNADNLDAMAARFGNNEKARIAISELKGVITLCESRVNLKIQLDLSLARGLDYYTGCIFEALVPDSGIGSVSGGGRYDDLTAVFGLKDVSGVGISFGIDRLYDVMNSRSMLDNLSASEKLVLCSHFDESSRAYAYDVANSLRAQGIQALVYPDLKKLKKQLDYANKRGAAFSIVIGDEEMKTGLLALKNMQTGESYKVYMDECIKHIKA